MKTPLATQYIRFHKKNGLELVDTSHLIRQVDEKTWELIEIDWTKELEKPA